MTVLYRVRARNLATTSTNKIHDDTVARRFGFAGGLVPGVDVYAYATHPVVEHFGSEWLANGAMTVRFEHPVYDGHETTVEREPSDADDALALGRTRRTGRAVRDRVHARRSPGLRLRSMRSPRRHCPILVRSRRRRACP